MSVQFDNIGDLKPKVTAGGKDKTKFVPNLNVSFFDDEFYFNLNRKDKIIKNEKAATARGKTSLGGIDTDIWYIDDKGRLKWDIEFASRPKINSWTWELKHAKSIEFYYQGELTAEEIADGCVRPDEVVGSYAVYCNKAHNKYKTGKLCHIYRPFCYDANGNTIYADLKIADGQMTISINAAWLDSAAYPVRLDPTIGYTAVGGSTFGGSANVLELNVINSQAPSNGVASKIYGYFQRAEPSTAYLGYYDDPTALPCSLIDSGTISVQTAGWYSVNVSGNIVAGNNYGPALNNGDRCYYYYDTGTSGQSRYQSGISGLPSSFSGNADAWICSLYLEYTESGGASIGPLVGASALVGGGVLCGQGNLIN